MFIKHRFIINRIICDNVTPANIVYHDTFDMLSVPIIILWFRKWYAGQKSETNPSHVMMT